jgi:DNA-binding IclR family transcriptional regulator
MDILDALRWLQGRRRCIRQYEMAEAFGVHSRTARRWLIRMEEAGFAARKKRAQTYLWYAVSPEFSRPKGD